jgi:hypothetical protein
MGALLAMAVLLLAFAAQKRAGGEAMEAKKKPSKARMSEVGMLVPAFADRVCKLVQAMRERGFDAIVWETLRSPERAKALADAGTGVENSMHMYGLAADVISAGEAWSAPPAFWAALGEEAEKLGLVWGGRWQRRDLAHVQAIRVSEQRAFRAMDQEQRQRVLEARFS